MSSDKKKLSIQVNPESFRAAPKHYSTVQFFAVSDHEVGIAFGTLAPSDPPELLTSAVCYMSHKGFLDFLETANRQVAEIDRRKA